NFFESGGHSLLATQLVSRIAATLQVDLPLRTLFTAPTIEALSASIEQARGQRSATAIAPLVAVSRQQDLPLSFAQQRLWFLDQLEPGSVAYTIPEAVRLIGTLHLEALERSLNEIVRRHEVLRTSFVLIDGEPWQQIQPALYSPLPLYDLS